MPNSHLQIPENPSKDDAIAALTKFREPFATFAYTRDQSEPAAIAATLTLLARDSLPAVPMFIFSGHAPVCGTTTIATITTLIGGVAPAVVAFPRKEKDVAKALVAFTLRRSSKVLVFEFIDGPLQSDTLSRVLTSGVVSTRSLGEDHQKVVETKATILGSGFRIGLQGDLAHRCVVCELAPLNDRSIFVPTLKGWVREHRDELAIAGLTILRAWDQLADKPDLNLTPMPRFEAWSDRVRSALVWLGMPDPVSECLDAD